MRMTIKGTYYISFYAIVNDNLNAIIQSDKEVSK